MQQEFQVLRKQTLSSSSPSSSEEKAPQKSLQWIADIFERRPSNLVQKASPGSDFRFHKL